VAQTTPGDAAQGVFWDSEGGCLVGAWHQGALQGAGRYHLPALSLAGGFEAGLPCGRTRFVRSAAAGAGEPAIAAAHLLAGARVALGPTRAFMAALRLHHAACMRDCAGRAPSSNTHSLQRSGAAAVTSVGVVRAQGQRPLQQRRQGRRRASSYHLHARATPSTWALRTCRPAMPPRPRLRLSSLQRLRSARRPGRCCQKRSQAREPVGTPQLEMYLQTARLLTALC